MSLSASDRKGIWQEHADSLTRIRTQLSDKRSPIPKTRSPAGKPGRGSHSPLGKYRRSTPPYLPRLETPPDSGPLRGSRYETVPPVYKTRASKQSDYDSWGEESESDDDGDQGQYMPQPYPVQSYPPPQVVFGAPFPMFYPPPPPQRRKQRDKGKSFETERLKQYKKPPDKDRFKDIESSLPLPTKSRKKNRVQFNSMPASVYPYPTFMYPYPSFYGELPQKESKYKYIQSRDTPYSADLPDHNGYRKYRDNPDAVSPLHAVRDGIIMDELPNLLHDVVRTSLNELVNEHMLYTQLEKDPLESFLTRLVNDAVEEAAVTVVRETVREMAREYVEYRQVDEVLDDLLDDYLDEIGQELVEDSVFDLIAEDFIENQVIVPDLDELIPEVATEVLSHYDTKVMRRELKEVSKHAGDKLIESIILDYLLSTVARQGHVWTESDHADKAMDDMIGTLLLEQLFNVTTHRRKTLINKPMRKLHEKTVTDVALDVLLQQLSATLDEDLLDVDEYERGVTDPYYNYWSPSVKLT